MTYEEALAALEPTRNEYGCGAITIQVRGTLYKLHSDVVESFTEGLVYGELVNPSRCEKTGYRWFKLENAELVTP